jgi:uncharacterized protein (DUF1778 family)
MSVIETERKTDRLVARISPSEKAVIEKAADLEGRKVAGFVVQHALTHAREVVRQAEALRLDAEQSQRFVEALLAPPRKPDTAFKKAYRAYRESVLSDVNPVR